MERDIAPPVVVKLLVSLGRPAQRSAKVFAALAVIAPADDHSWRSEGRKSSRSIGFERTVGVR
jgi:hypothetical protein